MRRILIKLPAGRKAIPTRWVLKVKRDEGGSVLVYRARLAIKGFHQKQGIDYDEVFAPVSKHATFPALMSLVCDQDLEVHNMDVHTTFLIANLDEEV
jgi:hypothetical protein